MGVIDFIDLCESKGVLDALIMALVVATGLLFIPFKDLILSKIRQIRYHFNRLLSLQL